MSEDALNERIAAAWADAGLDVTHDGPTPEDTDGDVEGAATDDDAEAPAAEDAVDDGTAAGVDTDATASVDTTDDVGAETDGEEAPAVEKPAPTAAEAQQEAEDDLAAALGLGKPPDDPKKRAQWWKKQLPYSLVHKTVNEREKKLKETHEGALKEFTNKLSVYDTRFADVTKVEDLIKHNPDHYVKTLADLFPDTYGKLFAPILTPKEETALPAAQAAPTPMPEPNYKLPDGNMTYDLEGIRALMTWQQTNTEQSMLQKFKPHLDSLEQERKAQQQATRAAEIDRKAQTVTQQALAEVKSWDLGEANLEEILKVAQTLDPAYDVTTALNVAYRQVVIPKLKANRDAMRQEILAEQKKASAKSTATTLTAGAVQKARTKETPDDAKLDLDTRIRNAWKRKGLI